MQCPRCSASISDELVFCTNCGKPVRDLISYDNETVVRQAAPQMAAQAASGSNLWLFLLGGAAIALFGIVIAAIAVIYSLSSQNRETAGPANAANKSGINSVNKATNTKASNANSALTDRNASSQSNTPSGITNANSADMPPTPPEDDASGTWLMTYKEEDFTGTIDMRLKQNGQKISGSAKIDAGGNSGPTSSSVSGKIDGSAITLYISSEGTNAVYSGTIASGSMRGTFKYDGVNSGTWTAKRR